MTTTRVCLLGADGRMGSTFAGCAPRDFEFVGGVVREGNPGIDRTFAEAGLSGSRARLGGLSALADLLAGADVLVSFSSPNAEEIAIPVAARTHVPVVSGTTGHSEAQKQMIVSAVMRGTRAVMSPNFSPGAACLAESARTVGRFASHFSTGIFEAHHSGKRDVPSGTALGLRRALGHQACGQVPIASLRCGDMPGMHEVILCGKEETVTLRHQVHSRKPFAEGAYLACRWLAEPRENGVYSFQDVLGGPSI